MMKLRGNCFKINILKIIVLLVLSWNFGEIFIESFLVNKEFPPLINFFKTLIYSLDYGNNIQVMIYYFVVASFDIILLNCLKRIFPDRDKELIIYYVLNPIIIYANYFVLDFDIIPVTFIIISMLRIFRGQYSIGGIFIGLALISKNPSAFALALIVVYIYKISVNGKKIRNIVEYVICSIGVYIVAVLFQTDKSTHLDASFVGESVDLLTSSFYSIGDLKVYLLPISLILIYARFSSYKKVNKELLYDYLGLTYLSFIILIQPEANWYLWSMIFVVILFIKKHQSNKEVSLLYYVIVVNYVLYFIVFDIWKVHIIETDIVRNLLFSSLEAILIGTCYLTYKFGIKSNKVYVTNNASIVIGVGGDSGSGKTTLLSSIKNLFGEHKIAEIEADGDHKWERGHNNWTEYTHLNPKANYLYRQARYLKELKKGNDINRVEYDHKTGKFTAPSCVKNKEYILVAGLHPFYLPQTRRLMDIKIYLDTDENLRRHWKIMRDIKKRGYSPAKIIEQIEIRMPDANKYIYPQRGFSDMIIKFYSDSDYELGDEKADIDIKLEIKIRAELDLDEIINDLNDLNVQINHEFDDDLKYQTIRLYEPVSNYFISIMVRRYVENIEEILDENQLEWMNGYHSFVQFMILLMVADKMKGQDAYEI